MKHNDTFPVFFSVALSVIHSSSVSGKESMEKLATEFLNKMRRFLEQEGDQSMFYDLLFVHLFVQLFVHLMQVKCDDQVYKCVQCAK